MAVPNSIKKPGTYVTIDNTKALEGAFIAPSKTVIIGQMTGDGSATAGQMVQVFSKAEADTLFGIGSMLSEQFDKWFDGSASSLVYAVPLGDAAGAAEAEWTVTITGPATANGTISLYINGNLVSVGVTSGDSETAIASAIEAAIGTATTDSTLPVIASASAGVVTLTAKNGGTLGNQITVLQNLDRNESTPAGVTSTIAVSAAGATDIDMDDAIAAFPDDLITNFVTPYTDTANMNKLLAEADRRWGELVQIDGIVYAAYKGTSSAVIAYGDALNSEYLTVMDAGLNNPVPAYLWSCATCAPCAYSASIDPAVPFRANVIAGVTGDTLTDKRNDNEINSLLNAGISVHKILDDGTVVIDRMVTTYKKNNVGAADASYLNLNTLYITSFCRQSVINMIETTYPQHKLADDFGNIPASQPIVTPSVMTGSLLALYEEWESLFICEDISFFQSTLLVSRDTSDRSRLNIYMRPTYVGQFYIADINMAFKL